MAEVAADLARRGVAVIVATGGEPAAPAAKAATSKIPIGVSLLTTAPESVRLGLLH